MENVILRKSVRVDTYVYPCDSDPQRCLLPIYLCSAD